MAMKRSNQEMQERIQALDEQRADAEAQVEASDRATQVQAALNSYPFANDSSREVAMNFFSSRIQREEDGTLTAGDLPLKDFVEQQMGNLGGLLQARQVGGSGASASTARGAQAPQMEQIKPGMSKDDRTRILEHSVALLGGPS